LQRQHYCIILAGLTLQISSRSPSLKTETSTSNDSDNSYFTGI